MKNNDLISRSALLHDLSYSAPELWCDAEYVIAKIERQPAVDNIVHAHWIGVEYDGYADGHPVYDLWECSACGEEHEGEYDTLSNYCPNCGAKMDEALVRMSP